MPLPTSLNLALQKIRKRVGFLIKDAPQLNNTSKWQEAEIEIGEILVSISLLLDKTMNAVYSKYGPNDGKKPNIYFPECSSFDKFNERMKKDKLADIAEANPELYALMQEPQPYIAGASSWWTHLRALALKRHEQFPEIVPGSPASTGLGRGQNISIGSISIVNGVMEISNAKAWSQETGKEEALRVDFMDAVEDEIRDTGLNPITFISHCESEASKFLMKMGTHL